MKSENLKKLSSQLKNKLCWISTILLLLPTQAFATAGSINRAEVNEATENIKNAVIKLAMPIRWNFGICKYCCDCFENDSEFK